MPNVVELAGLYSGAGCAKHWAPQGAHCVQMRSLPVSAMAGYDSGGVPMDSVIRYSPPLGRSLRVRADTVVPSDSASSRPNTRDCCRCMSRRSASRTNSGAVMSGSEWMRVSPTRTLAAPEASVAQTTRKTSTASDAICEVDDDMDLVMTSYGGWLE
jgi:hypothetical protein